MMKIRFLSACLLALVLVLSCTEEVSLETDAGTQVVITLKESAHATGLQEGGQVKSMLPEELLDQIRTLSVYVYNSLGHLEQVTKVEGLQVTLTLNRAMEYNIYATANLPELSEVPLEEDDFVKEVYSVSYDSMQENGIPMCGKVTLDASAFVTGMATIDLTRLITRVAFSVDKSNLATSALTITSVKLCQTTSQVSPFGRSFKPDKDGIEKVGDMASEQDLALINAGEAAWLYCLENRQGVLLPGNTDPWLKEPSMLHEAADVCTYLEVCAEYTGDYEGVVVSSENVVYRFYLGRDNIRDFTLERNRGVSVCLSVSDLGVFEREWKVDYGQSLPVVTYSINVSAKKTEVHVGESVDLRATCLKYVDGVYSSRSDVTSDATWTSTDPEIAAVDGTVLTGLATGTTRVYAKYQGQRDFLDFYVLPPPGSLVFRDDPVWLYPFKEQKIYFDYEDLEEEELDMSCFSAPGCEIVDVTLLNGGEGYVTVRRGEEHATTLKYDNPGNGQDAVLELISKDPELKITGPERVIQGGNASFKAVAWYDWPDGERESEDVTAKCFWDAGGSPLGRSDGEGNYVDAVLDTQDGDGSEFSTSTSVNCSYAGVYAEKPVLVYAFADYELKIVEKENYSDIVYFRIELVRHVYGYDGEIGSWKETIPYTWKLVMSQGTYSGRGNFNFSIDKDGKEGYINLKQAQFLLTFQTDGEYNSLGMPWSSSVTLMRDLELSDF